MLFLAIFALLATSAAYPSEFEHYSFNAPVGSGSGTPYSVMGQGRITALRVWERPSSYIAGFQVRYGSTWSPVAGFQVNSPLEMELFEGETFVQASGTYSHYVQSVVFGTSMGRSLRAGQPQGNNFNMYPGNKMLELRFLSGRYHGAITSIGTHWGVVANPGYNMTVHH